LSIDATVVLDTKIPKDVVELFAVIVSVNVPVDVRVVPETFVVPTRRGISCPDVKDVTVKVTA